MMNRRNLIVGSLFGLLISAFGISTKYTDKEIRSVLNGILRSHAFELTDASTIKSIEDEFYSKTGLKCVGEFKHNEYCTYFMGTYRQNECDHVHCFVV